jgi:hypothetical protein
MLQPRGDVEHDLVLWACSERSRGLLSGCESNRVINLEGSVKQRFRKLCAKHLGSERNLCGQFCISASPQSGEN